MSLVVAAVAAAAFLLAAAMDATWSPLSSTTRGPSSTVGVGRGRGVGWEGGGNELSRW